MLRRNSRQVHVKILIQPGEIKGLVVPKRPATVGHYDLKPGKIYGDFFNVDGVTVQGLGSGKIRRPGVEHHHFSGALQEFVKGVEFAVVGIKVLVGREEFETADPVSLDVRHHDLRDIGVVRIDGTKGNQFRMSLAKVEHEIIGNTSRYRGVVGDADGMVYALTLEEADEVLRSHQGFHRLHKSRAELGKLLDDSRVPESPVTYMSVEVDYQYAITLRRQLYMKQYWIAMLRPGGLLALNERCNVVNSVQIFDAGVVVLDAPASITARIGVGIGMTTTYTR